MRYMKYLMIPAAFLAGVFAVNTVQAQTAYIQPSYYSKTGYAPVPAGSYVSYSADGQAHTMMADDAAFYVKSQAMEPMPMVSTATYAPTVQYVQPSAPAHVPAQVPMPVPVSYQYSDGGQVVTSSDRTFVQPDGTFLNADGQPVWYVMGEPRVVVYRDTSDLPGYGVPGEAPTGYDAKPYDAQDFPAVYAAPGTASYYLENAFPEGG